MARAGDGVTQSGKGGNKSVSGMPVSVSGDSAQGPAPSGHPVTGKAMPSNPQSAAKLGENKAKQNGK